jgi:hypothetical protein
MEANKKWMRYRFKTKSIKDYRPLKFDPRYPWWCTGEGDGHVIIVAYLPFEANLIEYWNDAYDIDFEGRDSIEFSSRFPKPEYYQEDTDNILPDTFRSS